MSPEHQLVQQISQLLASGQLENHALLEDYAEQFAELCRSANERLLRCADYLDKGRRSEAVYEAHLAPDLLELSVLLASDGLKKWHNVCIDMELAQYQPLDNAIVERLRGACAQEEGLEPLLKEYRRCVYQSDHARCVELLRKIREKDPENPSWVENLRPLEEASLDSWLARAEQGLARTDLADLKIVFTELNHPMRVVKAPDELMVRLRRALLSERAVDLQAEAVELVAKIREAMKDEKVEALPALWANCEKLEADEAFLHRPADWESVQAESRELAEKVAQKRSRQKEFDQAVSHLKDMLMDSRTDLIELRHEYERLAAWELPMPKLLVRQINEVLAQRRAVHRRRTMIIGLSVGAVVVLAAVIGFILFRRHEVEARRSSLLSKAEQFERNGDVEELKVLMESIREEDAVLYQAPELVTMRDNMDKAQRRQEENDRRYKTAKATLEGIRAGGYRGDRDTIRRTLEDAEAVVPGVEEKAYLERWKSEWAVYAADREAQADRQLTPQLNGLQTALDHIGQETGAAIAAELQALEKVQEDFARLDGELVSLSSVGVQDRQAKMRSIIQARINDAKKRQAAWQEQVKADEEAQAEMTRRLGKLRYDLPAALPDLDQYGKLLEEFVAKGEGAPELPYYQALLRRLNDYRGVVALQRVELGGSLTGRETQQKVTELLAEGSLAASSVWRADLERLERRLKANEAMKRKVSGLMNLRKDVMYVLKYRRHGEQEWHRLYSERQFQTQLKDGVTYYWGSAFWASSNESRAVMTQTAEINGGMNFTSRDFEVDYSRLKEDNLAAHVKTLRRLVSEGARSEDVAMFILEEMQKMRGDSELDPVQAVLIFKKFVNVLAAYCLEELPECREWAALANAVQTDIPWQCATHPQTVDAWSKIARFWEKIPDLTPYWRRLDYSRRLQAAVLGSGVRCVGSVQLDAQGQLCYMPRERADELWVYQPAGNGALAQFKTLEQVNGVPDPQQLKALCTIGVPVFAPQMGREVGGVVRELAMEEPEVFRKVKMPQALPVNLVEAYK